MPTRSISLAIKTGTAAISAILILSAPFRSASAQQSGGWRWPLSNNNVGCLYFDPEYLRDEDAQHLGIDLPAGSGTRVNSPVAGRIIRNNASNSVPVREAYLVIRETATGYEHVLGHIRSTLAVNRTVARGDQVGTIANWSSNSHLHWGVNRSSVSSAMSSGWGWGRGPRNATRSQASNRGWYDINFFIIPRRSYC